MKLTRDEFQNIKEKIYCLNILCSGCDKDVGAMFSSKILRKEFEDAKVSFICKECNEDLQRKVLDRNIPYYRMHKDEETL